MMPHRGLRPAQRVSPMEPKELTLEKIKLETTATSGTVPDLHTQTSFEKRMGDLLLSTRKCGADDGGNAASKRHADLGALSATTSTSIDIASTQAYHGTQTPRSLHEH